MNSDARRTLRVFARFLVAGGLTKAVDAWIVGLDVTWQRTVTAVLQVLIALALHNRIDHVETISSPRPADRRVRRRTRTAAGIANGRV